MEHYLTFNGKSSIDYGIKISGSGTYNKPARRVERFDIPGRNGQLTVSDGSWENVIITYPAFAFNDFPAKMDWLGGWLLAPAGYCRLEDTYHPEQFRMAEYYGGIEPTAATLNRHGTFELSFNCKPQKYFKNGQAWMAAQNNTFVNPTGFPAKPLLKITGPGIRLITVNGVRVKVGESGPDTGVAYDEMYVDCETWEAYTATQSMNAYLELMDEKMVELQAGSNEITCVDRNGSDVMAALKIMPRWWTL